MSTGRQDASSFGGGAQCCSKEVAELGTRITGTTDDGRHHECRDHGEVRYPDLEPRLYSHPADVTAYDRRVLRRGRSRAHDRRDLLGLPTP
jgi:hypothetical protein